MSSAFRKRFGNRISKTTSNGTFERIHQNPSPLSKAGAESTRETSIRRNDGYGSSANSTSAYHHNKEARATRRIEANTSQRSSGEFDKTMSNVHYLPQQPRSSGEYSLNSYPLQVNMTPQAIQAGMETYQRDANLLFNNDLGYDNGRSQPAFNDHFETKDQPAQYYPMNASSNTFENPAPKYHHQGGMEVLAENMSSNYQTFTSNPPTSLGYTNGTFEKREQYAQFAGTSIQVPPADVSQHGFAVPSQVSPQTQQYQRQQVARYADPPRASGQHYVVNPAPPPAHQPHAPGRARENPLSSGQMGNPDGTDRCNVPANALRTADNPYADVASESKFGVDDLLRMVNDPTMNWDGERHEGPTSSQNEMHYDHQKPRNLHESVAPVVQRDLSAHAAMKRPRGGIQQTYSSGNTVSSSAQPEAVRFSASHMEYSHGYSQGQHRGSSSNPPMHGIHHHANTSHSTSYGVNASSVPRQHQVKSQQRKNIDDPYQTKQNYHTAERRNHASTSMEQKNSSHSAKYERKEHRTRKMSQEKRKQFLSNRGEAAVRRTQRDAWAEKPAAHREIPQEVNEKRVQNEEDQLYFSRKPRPVKGFRPKSTAKYLQMKPKEYYELGKLPADLFTDDLIAKRNKLEKVKAYAERQRTANAAMGTTATRKVSSAKSHVKSSRERALEFAKSLPRPRRVPKTATVDGRRKIERSGELTRSKTANGTSAPKQVAQHRNLLDELETKHEKARHDIELLRQQLDI